jgi:predicted nucleic acid-binding protein
MPLDVAPLDRELAESAAHLKNEQDLGLADAFAAALAKSRKAELVTADTEFKALGKEIKINWLK